MWTPRDIAARVRIDRFAGGPLQLACGVVMPNLNVETETRAAGDLTRLEVGGPLTGSVVLLLWWVREGLERVTLDSFFNTHHKGAAYEAALLEQSGGRSMTDVFMLLIDEIVYWILKANPDQPECQIDLLDVLNLRNPAPCALLGRTPFGIRRTSRYLEWARGSGYYVTYGFWPAEEEPQAYRARVAPFAHPHVVGAVQGDPQFQRILTAVERHAPLQCVLSKRLPPVLPPTTGALRTFADMDDYFARVVVPGQYGRPPPAPPPPQPTQPYRRVDQPPQPALASDRSADDIVAALRSGASQLPAGVYDGVPADSVELSSHESVYRVQLGRWQIVVHDAVAEIWGPLERVSEVAALAERLGARLLGEPVTVQWKLPPAPVRKMVVMGEIISARSDARFRPPGADRLAAAGLAPLDVEPADLPQLLREADRCDQLTRGRFVGQRHPQFAACRRVAQRMKDTWVRRSRKRARGASAEDD
jgi:hypothetical protein